MKWRYLNLHTCYNYKCQSIKHILQLHHASWDSLDAHSSDQYTSIQAGPISSSAPQHWDLKMILEELEKDSFLQTMDDLNEAMEDV